MSLQPRPAPRPRPRPVLDLIFAMAGPIVWAMHFFALYLAEAFFCPPAVSAGSGIIRPFAAILTVMALAALIALRVKSSTPSEPPVETSGALSFRRPLVDISIVAVLWTSIPLFLIEACARGAG
jgi:hypothetical protein